MERGILQKKKEQKQKKKQSPFKISRWLHCNFKKQVKGNLLAHLKKCPIKPDLYQTLEIWPIQSLAPNIIA